MATTSDVRSRIASTNEQFVTAFKQRDTAAIAGLYTSDGLVLPPNGEPVRGPDAIRAFWDGILKLGVDGVRLETLELTEHGDTAVEVGRATILGSGGAVLDDAKYLVVWRNDGGTWKLHRDIWNSNRSAAG